MKTEEQVAFLRGKIVAIAEAILNQEVGVVVGSRILSGLGQELYGEHNENFIPFVAVMSETDHLPVDWERRNWSVEALERKDNEIAKYEASAKDDVFAACKKLIQKFDM